MDSFSTYTERVLQSPPTVFGYKLLPLTLGHTMLLKAAHSHFMFGDFNSLDELKISELIIELTLAILICSSTYDEFLNEMHTGEIQSVLKEMVEHSTRLSEIADGFNVYDEKNKFIHYLKNGIIAPDYKIKGGSNSDIKQNPIEPEQAMVATLMSADCGFSRNECYNLPLSETLSAYILYAYKNDAIEITSKELHELMERKKKDKNAKG